MKRLIFMLLALFAVAGFAFAGGPGCEHKAAEAKEKPAATQEHHAEGDGHTCSMTEHASCPMSGKTVAETTDVTFTGKLLCRHCNLHQTETCEKVFQTAADETLYAVCLGGELAQAESASDHGEATLEVTGQLVKAEDGSAMLRILSAKKKV